MKINPFRKSSENTKRITPEGEPLEEPGAGGRRGGFFSRDPQVTFFCKF